MSSSNEADITPMLVGFTKFLLVGVVGAIVERDFFKVLL